MRTDRISDMRHDEVLLAAAAAGDQDAWDQLVDRYAQLVWDVARGYSLDSVLAGDVCTVTWLRCADHLDDLARGADLVGWLAATAAREADNVPLAASPASAAVCGTILDHLVQRRAEATAQPAV